MEPLCNGDVSLHRGFLCRKGTAGYTEKYVQIIQAVHIRMYPGQYGTFRLSRDFKQADAELRLKQGFTARKGHPAFRFIIKDPVFPTSAMISGTDTPAR